MHRRFPIRAGSLALAAMVLLAAVPPAQAQKSTLPPALTKVSSQPSVFMGQFRMARKLAEQALKAYQEAPEEGPFEVPHQMASNVYILIRAARSGIQLSKVQKKNLPDPLLEIAFRDATNAWNTSRAPVDKITWGLSRPQYRAVSMRALEETLVILDRLLAEYPLE